jgi:HEPN domain-containing protein
LAEHDLREAQRAIAEPDDPAFEIACFHAQQAAEKYLKALLQSRAVRFPNTHDLAKLGGLFPADLILALEDLARLTPFAVSSRYPGVDIPETREDAEFAIAAAVRVRDAVLPLI